MHLSRVSADNKTCYVIKNWLSPILVNLSHSSTYNTMDCHIVRCRIQYRSENISELASNVNLGRRNE